MRKKDERKKKRKRESKVKERKDDEDKIFLKIIDNYEDTEL